MSLAEANKKYFDLIADAYDSKPWFAKVNNQTTAFIHEHLDWVGLPFTEVSGSSSNGISLLDYACGPGLMSRIFAPYVTVTRGIDIAPNMVATYNARAQAAELPESKIKAVLGNIFSDEQSSELQKPEYHNFDLATVGFGFHHFEDVTESARRLKERLRPGGVLIITDFLEGGDLKADEEGNPIPASEGDHTGHIHYHDHSGHSKGHDSKHSHGHQHHDHHHHHDKIDHKEDKERMEHGVAGASTKVMSNSIVVPSFTIEGVKKFFTDAGLVDVDVITMKERVYMQFAGKKLWRTILFARGRRPLDETIDKSEL
ncbi:S-adenosyl-L-methionine-dependent methyltransferase [Aaosphaeria arxii CBS 175.79]|uniref:S-adenosyl-L-methionine-dependent methyltransferase n=1 Tax=Aaosphaeria arxii CBS 175.79 TaxID=1450172 RepID=A0A6A5XWU8_9PLEO|nr:S-adenosyl-L-methionine-dependent methyltransferase [Aaosphaeria arxii CBS 175.79]KAF2017429.1 S-adenosyl-L-methionine-dependent methyltransferase [Aaosphaeria arxii CBS 175.79]